jgi:hypothetical protein
MILISKYLIPKGYVGLALYPFVFLKSKELRLNEVLVNHEKIHLRQQLELLVLPFYVIYGFEFLICLFQFKKWYVAYRNISFEREAYTNEKKLDYLESRSFWEFLRYM